MPNPQTSESRRAWLRRQGWALATLALAFAGGGLFAFLGMPAGWLSGALVACAIAALAGAPVRVGRRVRDVTFVVLGTSIGAAVSPETLKGITTWPVTMVVLMVSLPAMMIVVGLYLEKVAKWDRRSAFFAAAPGALSAVLIMAETSGADVRRVVFGQSLRLFVLVALLPAAMGGLGHQPAGTLPINPVVPDLYNLLLSLGAGAVGAFLFERVRFPGGAMVGAMLTSGVLHGTGIVQGRLPDLLLIAGFGILGANSGGRFAGTSLATLRRFFLDGLVALTLAVSVAFLFAVAAAWLAGEPLSKVFLAYVPGALEAMTIMAFVLGVDPAFVAAHHLARFVGLSLALPLVVRFVFGPSAVPKAGTADPEAETKD
ncbi:AbrB family transcriptional regulator [Ancylobacter defluvii]|uniref:Membrane protein n=1 Tax=Ancylobacter defluvii TaxID=1282440 RepID=A0A9W6JZW4_9HYPH|nr:AbrB family transcriptional regulator [Ancylobacter defluvii]MBS7589544.1 AbrB family transcriptional regulator [Ancylobacter defluvii]GLK85160.1 membrane protein [Ancylobacter defluvii]